MCPKHKHQNETTELVVPSSQKKLGRLLEEKESSLILSYKSWLTYFSPVFHWV